MPTPIFHRLLPEPEETPAELEHVTDHVVQAQSRLLTQFQDKQRFRTLVSILVRPLQAVEDALWDIYIKRRLANATGEQLDLIGRILLEERGPLNDTDYRTVLSVKIRVLRSSGRGPELVEICELLMGSNFTLTEYFPAAIIVDILTTPTFDPALIARFLRKAKSAGVRLDVSNSGEDAVRYASDLDATSGVGGYSSDLASGDLNGFYAGDI